MIQTNKSLYLLYGLFCSQSSSGIVSADIVIGPRELLEAKTLRFWVSFLPTLLWNIFAGRATSGLLTAALQQCSDSRQTDAAVSAAVNSDAAEVNNCCLDTGLDEQWVELTKNVLTMTWFKSLDCYREALVLNRFCPLCRINKNALCTLRRIN